jgi:hypothetical protein
MDRKTQEAINAQYDALMFASTRETARKSARELIQLVLGDEAQNRSFEENMREVCRTMRPAEDDAEQARFEAEFLELVIAPRADRSIAA